MIIDIIIAIVVLLVICVIADVLAFNKLAERHGYEYNSDTYWDWHDGREGKLARKPMGAVWILWLETRRNK